MLSKQYLNKKNYIINEYKIIKSSILILINLYNELLKKPIIKIEIIYDLLDFLLIVRNNQYTNKKINKIFATIYMDLLLSLILISAKNNDFGLELLNQYTNIAINSYINLFDRLYDFPLANELCPINYPILAVIKILNHQNKHPRYSNFLSKYIISNEENDKLNKIMTPFYSTNLSNSLSMIKLNNILLKLNY